MNHDWHEDADRHYLSPRSDRQTIGRNYVEIYPGSRSEYYSAIASVSAHSLRILRLFLGKTLKFLCGYFSAATMAGATKRYSAVAQRKYFRRI